VRGKGLRKPRLAGVASEGSMTRIYLGNAMLFYDGIKAVRHVTDIRPIIGKQAPACSDIRLRCCQAQVLLLLSLPHRSSQWQVKLLKNVYA
jgi:hypothetical protein